MPRGRGGYRGRGRGRAPRAPRKEPNENLVARRNADGAVAVLLGEAEVVVVAKSGEVRRRIPLPKLRSALWPNRRRLRL